MFSVSVAVGLWIGQMARVFISRHNLYEPTYLLNVLAVVLTANAMPNWLTGCSIRQ